MDWQLYQWEEECSQFTPGATWKSDYHALDCTLWAPKHLDALLEDDEEALLNWEEGYGSRDWVNNVGAAVKLLEPLADQEPVICRYTPTSLVPWTWCCKVLKPRNRKALYYYGSETFGGLAFAITVACLDAFGVINNAPLEHDGDVEAQILQAAQLGPLSGVPSHRISSRYCHRRHTWIIEATHSTQDGEETDTWLTQYRNGHYVFQAV